MRIKSAALALACAWQAHALDVTGTVQDNFLNPLAGARVCLQGSGTQCVVTDAQGKFHWTGSAALRPSDPALARVDLAFRGGKALLRAGFAMTAHVEWFDARGARIAPALSMSLVAGDNALAIPASAAQAAFLRVSGSAFTVTWKLLGPGAESQGRPGAAAPGDRTAAGDPAPGVSGAAWAAKTAAASASLDVTLDKYKPLSYVPAQETEAAAVITLRPLNNKILWDGHGLDAWGANASWKPQGEIIHQDGGSGVLPTKDNYGTFRLSWVSRMLPGSDHKPNLLFWCKPGSTDNRTMGGIQFQPPMGSMWDYVKNNDPNGRTQTRLVPRDTLDKIWDALKWARCEALANQAAATIRFACCMLDSAGEGPCNLAREHVLFHDATYARSGPIALMIHDPGQKQEYKHIEVEPDPINADKMMITGK